jgi:hypothetical protein
MNGRGPPSTDLLWHFTGSRKSLPPMTLNHFVTFHFRPLVHLDDTFPPCNICVNSCYMHLPFPWLEWLVLKTFCSGGQISHIRQYSTYLSGEVSTLWETLQPKYCTDHNRSDMFTNNTRKLEEICSLKDMP